MIIDNSTQLIDFKKSSLHLTENRRQRLFRTKPCVKHPFIIKHQTICKFIIKGINPPGLTLEKQPCPHGQETYKKQGNFYNTLIGLNPGFLKNMNNFVKRTCLLITNIKNIKIRPIAFFDPVSYKIDKMLSRKS